MHALRSGYRAVRLRSPTGSRLQFGTLLLHLRFETRQGHGDFDAPEVSFAAGAAGAAHGLQRLEHRVLQRVALAFLDRRQPVEQPVDPRWDAAADAIDRGDFDAAVDAYRSILAETPTDPDATAGLAQVELLVLDVDGVLTDGGLWLDAQGRLQKRFDVRDGLGLKLLQKQGIQLAFLSGGQGGATDVRARHLGIHHCLVGIKDKPPALKALQERVGVTPQHTGYLGDDLNDLAVRRSVQLLIAPRDGCRPLRRQADAVLNRRGGHGAVRELAERILKARGDWRGLAQQGWRDRND